jgi:ribose transport system ATP-binding protein
MIYQELTLAPHLSVEENIMLGCERHVSGWIQRSEQRDLVRDALLELEHGDLDPTIPVNRLGVGVQQIVEIARALVGRARVIVMDEPTSSLSRADTERLFGVIRRLRDSGVSVIYISHFLEEVQTIGDRYTVLRDGETVDRGVVEGTPLIRMVQAMVGRQLDEMFPRVPHQKGEVILELEGLAGKRMPKDVSFALHRGEILGLAGLIGAGRTETLRALFGLDPIRSGRVKAAGFSTRESRTPAQQLRAGLGLLSEDRKEEGLALSMSIADNVALSDYSRYVRGPLLSGAAQSNGVSRWLRTMEVKARDPWQPVSDLSGGNQQKVALCRLLHHGVDVFLLDEPTRGIDVGSKVQIYQQIGEVAAQGKAVLFVSSYLPELLGVCDRIGVMCRGELREIRDVGDWDETSIMTIATGQESSS